MELSEANDQRKLSRRMFLKELSGAAAALAFTGCGTAATREIEPKPTQFPEPQPPKEPESIDKIKEGSTTFVFGKDVPTEQREEIQDAVVKATEWFSGHGINLENTSIYAFGSGQKTVDYYLERALLFHNTSTPLSARISLVQQLLPD